METLHLRMDGDSKMLGKTGLGLLFPLREYKVRIRIHIYIRSTDYRKQNVVLTVIAVPRSVMPGLTIRAGEYIWMLETTTGHGHGCSKFLFPLESSRTYCVVQLQRDGVVPHWNAPRSVFESASYHLVSPEGPV